MLIVLSLIIILIGIGIMCIDIPYYKADKNKFWKFLYKFDCDDGFKFIGGFTITIGFMALLVMLLILPINHVGSKAKIAECRERYNALIYKVESGACRDEFGLLNKEVLDEIHAWNQFVVHRKNIQKDFWIGIFWPNIYDQFETIDYEKYGRE